MRRILVTSSTLVAMTLGGGIALIACSANVMVDAAPGESFCLEWGDGGLLMVTEPPSDLSCELASNVLKLNPDAGVLPAGPAARYEVKYACLSLVERGCPVGPEIESSLSACVG